MPTQAEVQAARDAYRDYMHQADPRYPALHMLHEAAIRRALIAAEAERDEDRRKNCTHPRRIGNGMVCSDGSSESSWSCPDCGACGHSRTPPRPDGEGMRAMLSSLPR